LLTANNLQLGPGKLRLDEIHQLNISQKSIQHLAACLLIELVASQLVDGRFIAPFVMTIEPSLMPRTRETIEPYS
jgi:hypothetical protein